MKDNLPKLILGAALSLFAAGAVWVTHKAGEDEKYWKNYKTEHHCLTVDKEQDFISVLPVYTNGNNFTMFTTVLPGKIIYKCDNEEIIKR
jgi:hypothetical protein